MKAIFLTPIGPWRTALRSDTLWGLLQVAIRAVCSPREADDLLAACDAGEAPFRLSSAFPFRFEDGQRVCYFPKPLARPLQIRPEERLMPLLKQYKKERWLAQADFEAVLAGTLDEANLFERFKNRKARTQKNPCQQQEEKQPELPRLGGASLPILHLAVDRLTGTALEVEGAGQLYYTEEQFVQDGGLFALVEGDLSLVEPALRFLEHFGFGGDHATGKGAFQVEIAPFQLKTPPNPTHQVVLSLYVPTTAEMAAFQSRHDACWYELESRRGYLGTHWIGTGEYRKPPVYTFREGSVFPWLEERLVGRVLPLPPQGGIIPRFNGLALAVPACPKDV
jgi:CRISPR-associated protein Csm4